MTATNGMQSIPVDALVPTKDNPRHLRAGHRRLAAARQAGLANVPVIGVGGPLRREGHSHSPPAHATRERVVAALPEFERIMYWSVALSGSEGVSLGDLIEMEYPECSHRARFAGPILRALDAMSEMKLVCHATRDGDPPRYRTTPPNETRNPDAWDGHDTIPPPACVEEALAMERERK